MRVFLSVVMLTGLSAAFCSEAGASKKKSAEPSALDRYIQESTARTATEPPATPGSLWRPGASLASLGRDPRASQVDDIVTVLVAENASAMSQGSVKTGRTSSAKTSVDSLAKKLSATAALPNLLSMSSDAQLDGQGSTVRETSLTTTISARVTHVLPNGNLVIEGTKIIHVNSEQQTVTVRGVVRPIDLNADNSVQSARLAEMEVSVNGKGVVGDAIRRPFFLYRLLLGLLPF